MSNFESQPQTQLDLTPTRRLDPRAIARILNQLTQEEFDRHVKLLAAAVNSRENT